MPQWIWLGRGGIAIAVLVEQVRGSRRRCCWKRLQELGCEYGQGYFFSQPLEPRAALLFSGSRAHWRVGHQRVRNRRYGKRDARRDSRYGRRRYLVPFPGETTLPYSVARLRRSNIRHVSSDTLAIASSPSRSLRRKEVITQIT